MECGPRVIFVFRVNSTGLSFLTGLNCPVATTRPMCALSQRKANCSGWATEAVFSTPELGMGGGGGWTRSVAMTGKTNQKKRTIIAWREICVCLDTADWQDCAKAPQISTLAQTLFLRARRGRRGAEDL